MEVDKLQWHWQRNGWPHKASMYHSWLPWTFSHCSLTGRCCCPPLGAACILFFRCAFFSWTQVTLNIDIVGAPAFCKSELIEIAATD